MLASSEELHRADRAISVQLYGYVYPEDQAARETRVICNLHARKITLDAIHR